MAATMRPAQMRKPRFGSRHRSGSKGLRGKRIRLSAAFQRPISGRWRKCSLNHARTSFGVTCCAMSKHQSRRDRAVRIPQEQEPENGRSLLCRYRDRDSPGCFLTRLDA